MFRHKTMYFVNSLAFLFFFLFFILFYYNESAFKQHLPFCQRMEHTTRRCCLRWLDRRLFLMSSSTRRTLAAVTKQWRWGTNVCMWFDCLEGILFFWCWKSGLIGYITVNVAFFCNTWLLWNFAQSSVQTCSNARNEYKQACLAQVTFKAQHTSCCCVLPSQPQKNCINLCHSRHGRIGRCNQKTTRCAKRSCQCAMHVPCEQIVLVNNGHMWCPDAERRYVWRALLFCLCLTSGCTICLYSLLHGQANLLQWSLSGIMKKSMFKNH